jgi:putative methionine-R-sulfoxide reductase with GAF domain
MKNKYRLASIAFMLLFVGSVIYTVNYIFNFQNAVASNLSLVDINDIHKIRPLIFNLEVYTFLQVALGLAAFFFLMLDRKVQKHEIIYIEKKMEKTRQEELEEVQLQETEKLTAAMEEADKQLSRINKVAEDTTDKKLLAEKILQALCTEIEAVQGAVFLTKANEEKKVLQMAASFAYFHNEDKYRSYEFGEGLIGQVAKEARLLNLAAVPEGYITVLSGLGAAAPSQLLICPVVANGEVEGIVEIASFKTLGQPEEKLLKGVCETLASLISDKTISFAEIAI